MKLLSALIIFVGILRGQDHMPDLLMTVLTPSQGYGSSADLTLQIESSLGSSLIENGAILLRRSDKWDHVCRVEYRASSRSVYLTNDDGKTYVSAPIGSKNVLRNSQCSVNASKVTAVGVYNTLLITFPVKFGPDFHGSKSIFTYASDIVTEGSWNVSGAWIVP